MQFLVLLPAALWMMAVAPAAGDPFIGRWRVVPWKSTMPDEMKVSAKGENKYDFDFGGGVEPIVVDGTEQPGVAGTLLSVKAESADRWIVKRTKGGKPMLSATWTLSKDSRTLTDNYREVEGDGSTRSLDYVYQRMDAGSGFAGDWRSVKVTIKSPIYMDVKAFENDGLSIADPLEERTKDLKFDAAHGDKGPFSSLRRVDEQTLEVADGYDGKVIISEDFVLSPDSKTLTMTTHVAGRDRPDVLVFERM